MVRFTCTETNTRIKPLPYSDKITARQHMQKLIPDNSLGFKNSSYAVSEELRKISACNIREACLPNHVTDRGKIMAVMMPSAAGESNKSFVVKEMNKTQKRTPEATIPKWTLIESDVLFLLTDVRRIEHFFILLGLLLAWWALCLLFFYFHRHFYKNLRKWKFKNI